MIHLESNWVEIDREIDKVASQPTAKTTALLNTVLEIGFAQVDADIHVETGSLKSSLKKTSGKSRAKHKWEGTIRAGGPSTGVNNPVDYAIYEKRRGGAHDFFLDLPLLHPLYVGAIKGGLNG